MGGLVVVHRTIAASKPHGVRMPALNLLGAQAHARGRIALVAEGDDILAVEGLADRTDILLQALVGEQAARLRGGGGRARKRSRSLGDVGQELRRLERVGLLLEE